MDRGDTLFSLDTLTLTRASEKTSFAPCNWDRAPYFAPCLNWKAITLTKGRNEKERQVHMATRNEAKAALIAQVSAHFDLIANKLAEAPDATKIGFGDIGTLVGTAREANRAVMVDTGEKDEDGSPILRAKTAPTLDKEGKQVIGEDGSPVYHRVMVKETVTEAPDYAQLLAAAVCSQEGYTLETAGKNSGAWKGTPPKAAGQVVALKSEIERLRELLAKAGVQA
jgi:hypothetical protein